MKTQKIGIILLGLGLSLTAHANYGSSSGEGDPNETAQVINAQVDITKNAIDQMLRKLDETKVEGYNASDYKKLSPVFKTQVENAMIEFENQFKNNLLKKVSYWMNRYNSIYKNNEHSAEQKEMLLKQQEAVLKSQMELISKEYQKEVLKVYIATDLPIVYFDYAIGIGTLPNPLQAIKMIFNGHVNKKTKVKYYFKNFESNESFVLKERVDDYQYGFDKRKHTYNYNDIYKENYSFSLGADYHPKLAAKVHNSIFKNTYYPIFKEGCESQICLGLKAGDYSLFLTLVKTNIDRNINFKLLDGKVIHLASQNLNIDLTAQMISNVNYPKSAFDLPFDTEN